MFDNTDNIKCNENKVTWEQAHNHRSRTSSVTSLPSEGLPGRMTFRTTAYTAAICLLGAQMLLLCGQLLHNRKGLNEGGNQFGHWLLLHNLSLKLVVTLVVPLVIIAPPLFRRQLLRHGVCMSLNMVE